jgi:hypothetical protein
MLISADIKSEGQLKSKADSLKKFFNIIESQNASDDVFQNYFETVPNNFEDFKKIYGYEVNSSGEFIPGILYDESIDHIMVVFFELDKYVDKSILFDKLISIGIGGEWQADGINFFANMLNGKLSNNPRVFLDRLSKRNEDDIYSFLSFILSGPHGIRIDELNYLRSLANDYPKILESFERFEK